MRVLAVLSAALWLLSGGCGEESTKVPPPAEVTAVLADGSTVTVTTDPLSLTITRDGTVVVDLPLFVEVGVVDQLDETHYYDPAAPDEADFLVPERATAWDPATGALELPLESGHGFVTLRLSPDGILHLDAAGAPRAVHLRYLLPDGPIHGLGGLEDTPESSGVIREMQLRIDLASDSSTNERHVPVPLAILPRLELGFFAEELRPGAFDVGVTRADRTLVTFNTRSLTMYLLAGDAFEILDAYTSLTGRPRVPPLWAMAPMQWRNVHRDMAQVLEDAQALRANGIPGSTLWIDNPWQTGYNTFTFDPERFPAPGDAIAELGDLGFRVLVWSTPYVNATGPTADDHAEATTLGYLIGDDRGVPFDWPWQDGPGALVDFTRPGATDWWRERIARVTDLGISGFKLDFGEDLVPELGGNRTPFVLAGGGTDVYHNYYAYGYHEAYLGALPDGDGFLLTRAGAFGTQGVTTAVWPGDLDHDFSEHSATRVGGLPAAIAYGMSLSASGFPFYGSDIGGFRGGAPTAEALIRWAEYAALGTIMQLGGGGESHNPWDEALYGPDALPIYRRYARLHMDLVPYLYTLAVRAGETGAPVTYAPGLVHPDMPWEKSFFTGDALFVAPVVEEGATTRDVTLPPGTWVDWWTGGIVPGGVEVTANAPLDVLPLWRRAGALVPMLEVPVDTLEPVADPSAIASFADEANHRALRVVVTPTAGESTFTLHDSAFISMNGNSVGVTATARAGDLYRDVHFEIDWQNGPAGGAGLPATGDVPEVADLPALLTCPAPGCWFFDLSTALLHVRLVDVGAGRTATIGL